jgi:hypothetical protein
VFSRDTTTHCTLTTLWHTPTHHAHLHIDILDCCNHVRYELIQACHAIPKVQSTFRSRHTGVHGVPAANSTSLPFLLDMTRSSDAIARCPRSDASKPVIPTSRQLMNGRDLRNGRGAKSRPGRVLGVQVRGARCCVPAASCGDVGPASQSFDYLQLRGGCGPRRRLDVAWPSPRWRVSPRARCLRRRWLRRTRRHCELHACASACN